MYGCAYERRLARPLGERGVGALARNLQTTTRRAESQGACGDSEGTPRRAEERQGSMTPFQKSVRLLKANGYSIVERVEHWNSWAKCRQDLFGFADLLCVQPFANSLGLRGGEFLLVQTTTAENVSSRRKKILASSKAKIWCRAGGRIVIHGWRKGDCKDPRIESVTV